MFGPLPIVAVRIWPPMSLLGWLIIINVWMQLLPMGVWRRVVVSTLALCLKYVKNYFAQIWSTQTIW